MSTLLLLFACAVSSSPLELPDTTDELRAATTVEAAATPEPPPPAEVRALPNPNAHSDAAYREHLDQLQLPDGFVAVVQPPYVVIGDMPQEQLQQWASGTVSWADKRLRQAYFEQLPLRIIDVWLFKDDASYMHHVEEFFGEAPDTPYGFANEQGLFMNIGTGGGTLVHEMVHPYVEANLPQAAPWVNEGLASLYEACADRDGRITGLLNWRLDGLQQTVREGRLPSFRWLTQQSNLAFYEEDPGSNYGQSRYLMYYLQEQGLLQHFMRRYAESSARDPSGYTALVEVLGEADMKDFQRRWEAWVLGLGT